MSVLAHPCAGTWLTLAHTVYTRRAFANFVTARRLKGVSVVFALHQPTRYVVTVGETATANGEPCIEAALATNSCYLIAHKD
jgi:hypothetical protein